MGDKTNISTFTPLGTKENTLELKFPDYSITSDQPILIHIQIPHTIKITKTIQTLKMLAAVVHPPKSTPLAASLAPPKSAQPVVIATAAHRNTFAL